MSYIVEDDGTVKLIQGDTARIPFYEIPTDKDYLFSLGIFDAGKNFIGEFSKRTEKQDILFIDLPAEFTDKLRVYRSFKFQVYFYGVKLSDTDTGMENTCTVNFKEYGSLNRLVVYPKQSEGIINEQQ